MTRGPTKFAAFLKANGISKTQAAREFKVTHTAVISWIKRISVPDEARRTAIEVWTSGKVPAEDWIGEKEREKAAQLAQVRPFGSAQ